jgi:hypothetical protein
MGLGFRGFRRPTAVHHLRGDLWRPVAGDGDRHQHAGHVHDDSSATDQRHSSYGSSHHDAIPRIDSHVYVEAGAAGDADSYAGSNTGPVRSPIDNRRQSRAALGLH